MPRFRTLVRPALLAAFVLALFAIPRHAWAQG